MDEGVPLCLHRVLYAVRTTDIAANKRTTRTYMIPAIGGTPAPYPDDKTPAHLLLPGNPEQHWVASSRRIREELGYRESVPSAEALRRTIAWERTHPPAPIDTRQFDYAAEDAALASG